jgi:hypothetical protein
LLQFDGLLQSPHELVMVMQQLRRGTFLCSLSPPQLGLICILAQLIQLALGKRMSLKASVQLSQSVVPLGHSQIDGKNESVKLGHNASSHMLFKG